MNKKAAFIILTLLRISYLWSQTVLGSDEEMYFDFLALNNTGVQRNYLNYRTLSDSVWAIDWENEYNLWKMDDGKVQKNLFSYKIFGPEWYSSYNSTAPYGQNDGGLWQGKGFNTAFTAGFNFKAFGFELNFKPQFSFSQNKSYDYPSSSYSGNLYKGKADTYGYYGAKNIDSPLRFGNKSFVNFDFGDSEIRYTLKNFTLGFGTEYIITGPAQLNPLLHSNNAQSYPKIDIGLKKSNLKIKNLDFGDFEFRYWLGQLTESDYFDNDSTNNKNLIAGLSAAWSVPFLKGLTIGYNRTMLSKWSNISPYTTLNILIPGMDYTAGYDESDQRGSLTFDYFIPKGGIDLYLEWAKNDYNTGIDNLLRYPFHTQAITAGFKKNIKHTDRLYGQLLCEISYLESSADYMYFYDWGGKGATFYTHSKITQGYTNRGQYLGAGIGSGGNSQYLGYRFYYPKGQTTVFVQRVNPDLDYYYFWAERNAASETPNEDVKKSINVNISLGVNSTYNINKNYTVSAGLVFIDRQNPMLVNETGTGKSTHVLNVSGSFDLKIKF